MTRLLTDAANTAYIDESYTDTRYYVAAAIAPNNAWAPTSQDVDKLRRATAEAYGLPPDIEFHASDMFGGRRAWKPLRGCHREVGTIASRLLSIATDHDVSYVVRGIDIPSQKAAYSVPHHPHGIALEHTLQRVESYGRSHDLPARSITIIADEIDRAPELQAQFLGYQQEGTHTRFNPNKLEHLVSPIQFMSSHTEAGLQIVDLIAYLYRRRETVLVQHPRALALQERLMSLVMARMYAHGTWFPKPK